MTKKEKVKKFIEEHKSEIEIFAIVGGGAALLGVAGFACGRLFERHKLTSSDTAAMGLAMNKVSNNVLAAGDLKDGLGKMSDISSIVAKGLEEAGAEGHLDDTVIGYMVYVKDNVKS